MRGLVRLWTNRNIVCAALWLMVDAGATTLDDIGYTALQTMLGGALPTGDQLTIDQIEASNSPEADPPIYLANESLSSFPHTQIIDRSGLNSAEFSGHANSVANRIGGITESQLPSLFRIDAYEVNDWTIRVLERVPPEPPDLPSLPQVGSGAIGNHSYAGGLTDPSDMDEIAFFKNILLRLDWLVAEDDYFHAVGASSPSNSVLMAHAMNVIGVKNTAATINMATLDLADPYQALRPAVQLVAPASSPSDATGVVSSSAGLLKALFPGAPLVPELMKAILMASALRDTNNTQGGQIINYGAQPSLNGLDYRYGAGQLNVLNAYEILNSGTQNSNGSVTPVGYHWAENFGARNQVNIYQFESGPNPDFFVASLVWNLNLNSLPIAFTPNPILYNLNLGLYDVTDGGNILVSESNSEIDNTENIRLQLVANRHYELRVSHSQQTNFDWPYALAWRLGTTAIPNPTTQIPAVSNFLSALLGILVVVLGWRVRTREC